MFVWTQILPSSRCSVQFLKTPYNFSAPLSIRSAVVERKMVTSSQWIFFFLLLLLRSKKDVLGLSGDGGSHTMWTVFEVVGLSRSRVGRHSFEHFIDGHRIETRKWGRSHDPLGGDLRRKRKDLRFRKRLDMRCKISKQ